MQDHRWGCYNMRLLSMVRQSRHIKNRLDNSMVGLILFMIKDAYLWITDSTTDDS
jgi:hypothetical protein